MTRTKIIFATLLLLPVFTLAQFDDPTRFISLSISPASPGAEETVKATVESYSVDLSRATINWYLGGALKAGGVGKKTFEFKTGKVGTAATLSVAVVSSGQTLRQSLTIRPASVDLIWESLTYTPAFYRGKPLHSSQSFVRLTAFPQLSGAGGARIAAENLFYSWEKNGNPMPEWSGLGKRTVGYVGPKLYGTEIIKVTVSNQSQEISASGVTSIKTVEPGIAFYKENPLSGPEYQKALSDSLNLTEEEVTILAEPYFFSLPEAKDGGLSYQWSAGGKTVTADSGNPGRLTLRQGQEAGETQISLIIDNPKRLLQKASRLISVKWGGF